MILKLAGIFKSGPDLITVIHDLPENKYPVDTLGKHGIHAHYIAVEDIQLVDDLKIPKGRWGNLGPNHNMVYFGTGLFPNADNNDYTVACTIEVVILNPELFEPRMNLINNVEFVNP